MMAMSRDYHVTITLGRVARAGRTGSAYSLVSSNELPYCFDLHLFIGRSLLLARPDCDNDERLGMTLAIFEEGVLSTFHSRGVRFGTAVHSG